MYTCDIIAAHYLSDKLHVTCHCQGSIARHTVSKVLHVRYMQYSLLFLVRQFAEGWQYHQLLAHLQRHINMQC